MVNGLASSVTEVSPKASRARIARRVGSDRAAKAVSSDNLAIRLNNYSVKYSNPPLPSSAANERAAGTVLAPAVA
jgi:hypothetical protein